jgi:hypothetical protein
MHMSPKCHFPSDFLTKILYEILIFRMRATCVAHLIRLDLFALIKCRKVYKF